MSSTVPTKYGEIRTMPRLTCCLCGGPGRLLYARRKDPLYGIPGVWDFRRCNSPGCDLIWLDPAPLEEDTSKMYGYFRATHEDEPSADPRQYGGIKKLLNIRQSYLKLRYHFPPTEAWQKTYRLSGLLAYLHPVRRTDIDFPFRLLEPSRKGRLLDVGCGGGRMMQLMQRWGWQVEGVDFDAQAVENARHKGLTVHLGSLADQGLAAESFDAIIMSEVIEHVHDPIAFLRETWRVLRPGGHLVLSTPNAWSLGHRIYRQNWILLHPPVHLLIFNPPALSRTLREAGFAKIMCSGQPRCADQLLAASRCIQRIGSFDERLPRPTALRLYGLFMGLVEWGSSAIRKNLGEDIVAVSIK
jgi:2-polyprenyl-3-methyl-5-hydroxy-6-metoxy-1,4-benzoquinol methylase